MTPFTSNQIQTVTELTRSIRGILETQFSFVAVAGEVSNLRRPYSGHIYFTLKDEEAQLKAVLFKPQQRYLAGLPEDGMGVVCRGRISVYEPRGEYQLIVDFIDFTGSGALQVAFEQLKARLAAEGLFDPGIKRELPPFPGQIALVTSPTGAAVHDFLKTARARGGLVPIEIYPVRVQGPAAADEIVAALNDLNSRATAEVIVLCRGGGSLEDLWPFNEEKVARAIHSSKIPVVSAVGHEIDFTIADFAADLRAATPTAAAELVMPDRTSLAEKLSRLRNRLHETMQRDLDGLRARLEWHLRLLGDPSPLLTQFRLRLDHAQTTMEHAWTRRFTDRNNQFERLTGRLLQQNPAEHLGRQRSWNRELDRRLRAAMAVLMERRRGELDKTTALLEAVSPLAVLGRGYAIVRTRTNTVVRDSRQVTTGALVNILLQKGKLNCEVLETLDGNGNGLPETAERLQRRRSRPRRGPR